MSALANTFCTAIIGKNATKVTMQNGRKRRDITETARLSTRPTRKSPSAKWVAAVSTEACVMQSHLCAGADRIKHEHGQRHHGSLDGRYGTGSDIRRAGRPIPIRGARCDRAMRGAFERVCCWLDNRLATRDRSLRKEATTQIASSQLLQSVARGNRVAGAAELVAHAAEHRPHPHTDVVIGEILDPAVRMRGAEGVEVSFDAEDPVAGQQQLAAEPDGPANLGV